MLDVKRRHKSIRENCVGKLSLAKIPTYMVGNEDFGSA
jgi:hypothetical protein